MIAAIIVGRIPAKPGELKSEPAMVLPSLRKKHLLWQTAERQNYNMEQRTYHGNVSAEGLADFLAQHYGAQHNVQAQRFGEGDSLLVQIGYGDDPAHIRHAVTIAVAATKDEQPGIVVTMGQRQWITPDEAEHAAFWGLLAVILTPWVLFALLWPLSEVISSSTLPGDIWSSVEAYAASQGATNTAATLLTHPHLS
jgi:hypothetical protein